MSSELLSLNEEFDRDYLIKVYDHEVRGRCSGKSVAYVTYIFGCIETTDQLSAFITGPSMRFLDHFRMLMIRVANEMEVPYKHLKRYESLFANCKVHFVPYQTVVERSRGPLDLVIYDVNDMNTDYFEPIVLDKFTIGQHIQVVTRSQTDSNLLHQHLSRLSRQDSRFLEAEDALEDTYLQHKS